MAGLAHGLPIVSTRASVVSTPRPPPRGNAPVQLRDGVELLLVPPGRPGRPRAGNRQPGRRSSLARAPVRERSRCVEPHRLPEIARQTLAVYQTVFADARPGATVLRGPSRPAGGPAPVFPGCRLLAAPAPTLALVGRARMSARTSSDHDAEGRTGDARRTLHESSASPARLALADRRRAAGRAARSWHRRRGRAHVADRRAAHGRADWRWRSGWPEAPDDLMALVATASLLPFAVIPLGGPFQLTAIDALSGGVVLGWLVRVWARGTRRAAGRANRSPPAGRWALLYLGVAVAALLAGAAYAPLSGPPAQLPQVRDGDPAPAGRGGRRPETGFNFEPWSAR